MSLLVQHVHMCLWPHLIAPFIELATNDTDSRPHPHPVQAAKKGSKVGAAAPRVELSVAMNNISLALLDKPSDLTSYGLCAEVRNLLH